MALTQIRVWNSMENLSLMTNSVYKKIKMRRKNDSAENNDVENLQ